MIDLLFFINSGANAEKDGSYSIKSDSRVSIPAEHQVYGSHQK
jgi:hypothetical protein